MENLTIINQNFELANKSLVTQYKKLLTIGKKLNKASFEIAEIIRKIKTEELWKDDFETFDESIKPFGFTKSHADRLIFGINFKDDVAVNVAPAILDLFSMTQLIELSRLDAETVANLINDNVVDNTMTCAQLRKIVNGIKNPVEENEETEEVKEVEETDDIDENATVELNIVFGDYEYTLKEVAEIRVIVKALKKMGYTV